MNNDNPTRQVDIPTLITTYTEPKDAMWYVVQETRSIVSKVEKALSEKDEWAIAGIMPRLRQLSDIQSAVYGKVFQVKPDESKAPKAKPPLEPMRI